MSFTTTVQGESVVIGLPLRFDFSRMKDFRAVADTALDQAKGDHIIIDFASTEYVDSSTLGALLVVRDRARGKGKSVILAGAHGTVKDILGIAKFEKLFAFR